MFKLFHNTCIRFALLISPMHGLSNLYSSRMISRVKPHKQEDLFTHSINQILHRSIPLSLLLQLVKSHLISPNGGSLGLLLTCPNYLNWFFHTSSLFGTNLINAPMHPVHILSLIVLPHTPLNIHI